MTTTKRESEKVVEQTFIEPVYFKYKAKYFSLKDVTGLKKVVINIRDGQVKAYAKITKVRRTAKKRGFSCEDSIYNFMSMDELHQYFVWAFEKLLAKNSSYTFSEERLNFIDFKDKTTIEISNFNLVLYYVNAKLIGGYWMTIKRDTPFEKFENPKYVKIRRCLRDLQLRSRIPETFSKNLMNAIQQAYIVKADNVPEFYGQD